MKKLLFSLLIPLLLIPLWAQSGLFDISYGDTKENAIAILVENGFEVLTDNANIVDMSAVDNYRVDGITMEFSGEPAVLTSWTVAYIAQEEEDIEALVMEALISRHGEGYEWDDYYEQYYWSLGEDHYVYTGYDYDGYYYYVEYTTEVYSEDTETDDDEYWEY